MHQTKIAVETKCNSIKLAFLNIRSLKSKSFLINDLITTNNLDFMFLNETWLEDSCSATVLNETAPPNFNFISVCRTVRRVGGVAALLKYVYQCKQVSFGQYLSFEYLGIVLKGAPHILFIIVYSKILSSLCWRVHRTVINDFLRVWLFCYCRGF